VIFARTAAIALSAACAGVVAQPASPPPTVGEAPYIGQESKDSVWVPTPARMIHRMLQIADTTKDDLVIDLGSGDGRIPIHAARHFGAQAIGVELEANLIRVSRETAKAQGVDRLAQFVQQDLYEADLSKATVIALYISPDVMTRLRPRLLALKPGTRVVSHQFQLGDWEADETVFVEGRNGYLWVVPADARGRWTVRIGEDSLQVTVTQQLQKLETRGARAGRSEFVISPRLRGTEISFTAFDADGSARHFEGRIEGNRMSGTSSGQGIRTLPWSATRN
jgi:SAM-dependent methyltransferase